MAIKSYEKNGETFWEVYLNIRDTAHLNLRLQRRSTGLKTNELAHSEEKRLYAEIWTEITRLKNQGLKWEEIIDRWERYKLTFGLDQTALTTIKDSAKLLRNWTRLWLIRPARDLTRGDGREILKLASEASKSAGFVRRLKSTIHRVFEWGIEEHLIVGIHQSPVFGIDLGREKEMKVPEVLTITEAHALIAKAEERRHPWTPIWKGALLTGMRSGELLALPWSNVELVSEEDAKRQVALPETERRYGLIRAHRTWNGRLHAFGPTKGGYWRSIPVSKEFYGFLCELRKQTGDQELVFPQFSEWNKGMQAAILRLFCTSEKLKSIKFHALRATFATLLISKGVAPARVMKVCGWKDLKTMQFYIRLAGIDEQGATESLHMLVGDRPANVAPHMQTEVSSPTQIDGRKGESTRADEDDLVMAVIENLMSSHPQKITV